MCVCVQAVADHIPQLVQGMRSSQAEPEELSAQLTLIMASQSFLQVLEPLSLPHAHHIPPHCQKVICVFEICKYLEARALYQATLMHFNLVSVI